MGEVCLPLLLPADRNVDLMVGALVATWALRKDMLKRQNSKASGILINADYNATCKPLGIVYIREKCAFILFKPMLL